jgi:hypothetical protein
MKIRFVTALVFSCSMSFGQQDSSALYWNDLSKQLAYRADLAKDFGNLAKGSGVGDSLFIDGINEVHGELSRLLSRSETIDSSFLADVINVNSRLIGFLGRLIVQLSSENDRRDNEAYRKFQVEFMNAENQIFAKQDRYNDFCQRTGRRDLFYKR